MGTERLDKMLAKQNKQLSRRDIKNLVRKKQIVVNGSVVEKPDIKISEDDEVFVSGKLMVLRHNLYLMLNKPQGYLCATRDNHTQTVLDLVPPHWQRNGLFPAGRLDKDTEGFVLLTDDGAFAHRILSPKNHVPKTYYVELDTDFDEHMLAKEFAKGVKLGEEITSPSTFIVLEKEPFPKVELTIYEGMFHQVKRMFSCFGIQVTYLKRIRIGGLDLDSNLPLGVCREILHKELELI